MTEGGEGVEIDVPAKPCETSAEETSVRSPLDLLVDEDVITEAEPQSELQDHEEAAKDEEEELASGDDASDANNEGPEETTGAEESDEPDAGSEGKDNSADDVDKNEDDKSIDDSATDDTKSDKDEASNNDATKDDDKNTAAPEDAAGDVTDDSDTGETPTTTPSVEPAPEPAPAPAPSGPTTPSRVSTAVPFTMVATDGSDLGTATVRDVSRSNGCVAVLLDVTTSDGSGTTALNGLRSNDFREVLADGDTAPVASPSAPCAVETPMPTTFAPGTTYSGWVTFDLANGGNSVMLRPIGTAGWIITLPAAAPPPPAPAPAPAPTVTPPPTVEEIAPAVETAPASAPATSEQSVPTTVEDTVDG